MRRNGGQHPPLFLGETLSLNDAETTPLKQWQWKPGVSPNPAGRPKGSKNKLGEAFVAALHEDFQEHGAQVIETVRQDRPDVYLKVIAQVIPKELTINKDSFGDITDEQLAIILAAARSALGIIDGDAKDITDAPSGKQAKTLPAIQEAK